MITFVNKTIFLFMLPIYFIAISFITSFRIYKQYDSEFYLKLFPPYLGLSLVIEIIAIYLVSIGAKNYILYSAFGIIEFAFFLYVLSEIIKKKSVRRLIRITLVLNALISASNILFFQTNTYTSISYSFGSLLLVVFCIYYFFELFRYPKFIRLINEPSFWICSGLLFYYCCSFPLLGLTTLLSYTPPLLVRNAYILLIVLNSLLYTLFIIAFLCRIRIRKPISR